MIKVEKNEKDHAILRRTALGDTWDKDLMLLYLNRVGEEVKFAQFEDDVRIGDVVNLYFE